MTQFSYRKFFRSFKYAFRGLVRLIQTEQNAKVHLVAATLVLYPLYRDTVSGLPCGPETALDRLLAARARAMTWRGAAAARLRHAYALTRHRMLGPIARRLP